MIITVSFKSRNLRHSVKFLHFILKLLLSLLINFQLNIVLYKLLRSNSKLPFLDMLYIAHVNPKAFVLKIMDERV